MVEEKKLFLVKERLDNIYKEPVQEKKRIIGGGVKILEGLWCDVTKNKGGRVWNISKGKENERR